VSGAALRVEVDSADAMRRAVAAARAAGSGLVLESPPAAAGWQGIGWWRELVALARAEAPDLDIAAVLDCGAAPGLALAALKAGCGPVRVVAEGAALDALVALAAGLGGEVLAG
jgi:hypothetical protein